MTIDFEKDQQDAMKKTEGIQSLADQVERLELVFSEIDDAESRLKLLNEIHHAVLILQVPSLTS